MSYCQITPEERYMLATLRRQDPNLSFSAMARILGRHRSSISREFARNRSPHDGRYRHEKAQEHANGRRSRSRRKSQFTIEQWCLVESLLLDDLSPEQVSGRMRLEGRLRISHETIYQYILKDKREGGTLFLRLRQRMKKRRKRYGARDRRGRLEGKRHISERPAEVEHRRHPGHLEIDTVMGSGGRDCVVTLVDRATGEIAIGKLEDRTVASLNKRVVALLQRHPGRYQTITADNGTEFHGYEAIERAAAISFYFANPYHSWERASNENANGLVRQYLPKRSSMKNLTQRDCDRIAAKLNKRPRKRYGFLTPVEKREQLLAE